MLLIKFINANIHNYNSESFFSQFNLYQVSLIYVLRCKEKNIVVE